MRKSGAAHREGEEGRKLDAVKQLLAGDEEGGQKRAFWRKMNL